MANYNNLTKTVVQITVNSGHTNVWAPFSAPNTGTGDGSGFLLQKYPGLIITNAHVIEGAIEIEIRWPEVSSVMVIANILSYCKERDVAVLKLTTIPAFLQPWVGLDLSTNWYNGQQVEAAGYPRGERQLKTTLGQISGLQAEANHNFWEDPELVPLYLEMTAIISPGSSGGVLLNDQGQCIGITSAGDPANLSMNLTIPSLVVNSVLPILSTGNKVNLVKLACLYQISYTELNQYLGYNQQNSQFNTNENLGVYVTKVFADTSFPDLKAGSLLLAIKTDKLYPICYNGSVIDNEKLLPLKMITQACNKADIIVWQDGKLQTLNSKGYKVAAIREVDIILEPYDYKIIAGLCLAPLTLNHVADTIAHGNTRLAKYLDFHGETYKNRDHAPLIISHIFAGTRANNLGILQEADIVDSYQIKDDHFILTTDDDKVFIISLDQAHQDDDNINKRYNIKLTSTSYP